MLSSRAMHLHGHYDDNRPGQTVTDLQKMRDALVAGMTPEELAELREGA